MRDEVRHCPECRTEFVSGIESCSDCGGALRAGELPRDSRAAADVVSPATVPEHGVAPDMPEPPDTLVATLPGEDAERVARALAMEQITSLLDCEGTQELRGPQEPPKPPIARRKPVSLYVAHARLEEAREIVDSLMDTDLIGDQWRSAGEGVVPEVDPDPEADAVAALEQAGVRLSQPELETPQAEGGARYLILLAALGAVLALFIALL